MEFVARAGKTPEPHAFEAVVNLQVSKAHLDALSFIARFEEGLCPRQTAGQITRLLMDITWDLSSRCVGTALHLERTDVAIDLRGAIAKHVAIVQSAGCVQYLVVRTEIDASPAIPAKVAAREGAVVTLAAITYRDMRRNPTADQPAEEAASSISGVGRQPLRLQVKATLGASEHRLCGLDLVVGTRRRRLDINNDRILDVDEIIEPVAELHSLIGLGRPCRARIAW